MTLTMPDGNSNIRKTPICLTYPALEGASMNSQHKTLPDGTGAGHGGSWQENYARQIGSWTRTNSGKSNISGPAATQWNHGEVARGGRNNQWHQDGGGQCRTARQPHSNTRKVNLNLIYCYSCGYDVDHAGWKCSCKKTTHIPNVPQYEAHTVAGASMKAQHKTLTDGTGAGNGWILTGQRRKANWFVD